MYEKPQYLTPDGYRRSSQNPNKEGTLNSEVQKLLAKKAQLKKLNTTPQTGSQSRAIQPGSVNPIIQQYLNQKFSKPKLSENAAKLIATAISGLLNSK